MVPQIEKKWIEFEPLLTESTYRATAGKLYVLKEPFKFHAEGLFAELFEINIASLVKGSFLFRLKSFSQRENFCNRSLLLEMVVIKSFNSERIFKFALSMGIMMF
jgi:hypothetical protein